MIVQNAEQIGIVFSGERSHIVYLASAELKRLGYLEAESDIADEKLMLGLNSWRKDNSLPQLDFVDPLSLRRLLSENFGGDELILLARCAEKLDSEAEKYKFCRNAVTMSKSMLVSLTRYLAGNFDLGTLAMPSADSVRCAVIAYLVS